MIVPGIVLVLCLVVALGYGYENDKMIDRLDAQDQKIRELQIKIDTLVRLAHTDAERPTRDQPANSGQTPERPAYPPGEAGQTPGSRTVAKPPLP